jgi:hypothetical protein
VKEEILNYIHERKLLLEEELESYGSKVDESEAYALRSQIVLLEELWTEIKSFQ